MKRRLILCIAIALAGCTQAEVSVYGAWTRTPPPGANNAAAYFELRNGLDIPLTITTAESEQFAKVMIHETRIENGIARMQHAAPLTVAPKSTVSFTPNGLHLMLMGPKQELRPNQAIKIRLQFHEQPAIEFNATIMDQAP